MAACGSPVVIDLSSAPAGSPPMPTIRSIAGICEVRLLRGASATEGAPPDLLIEVPHGATRARHYDALRAELRGTFPDNLEAFFHVNTDAGAPEIAWALAQTLVAAEPGRSVLVVTSEIPRTFIDCNRMLDASPEDFRAGGVTPGLPPYVRDEHDRRLLRERHAAYVEATAAAYAAVCDAGGLAVMAHTYAPRSVDVEVDDQIVASLRRAYAPAVEPTWLLRPQIDLIARDPEGRILSEALVERVAAAFRADGFEPALGATYPLHPSTIAFHRAQRYQPRALCLEVRRDLITDGFVPFVEVVPSPAKIARVVAPLARALRETWAADR